MNPSFATRAYWRCGTSWQERFPKNQENSIRTQPDLLQGTFVLLIIDTQLAMTAIALSNAALSGAKP